MIVYISGKIKDFFYSGRLKRAGKEMIWVGLGQGIALLGSFAGVKLLTTLLTPENYGLLSLGLTIATLATQMLMGPLANGAVRFFAASREVEQDSAFLQEVFLLLHKTGFLLLLLAMILFFIFFYVKESSLWAKLISAAVIYSIASGYNNILLGLQNAARQRIKVALLQGTEVWLRFGFAIVLLMLLAKEAHLALWGYCFGLFPVLILQLIFFRKIAPLNVLFPFSKRKNLVDREKTYKKINNESINKIWQKKIIEYSLPFAFMGIFTSVHLISDRWFLEFFTDTDTVGLYSALFQVGFYPIIIATSLVVQLISPVLFQRAGDGSNSLRMIIVFRANNILILFSISLTVFIFFVFYFFANNIFSLLVDSKYHSVANMLPWLSIASGLFATGQIASMSLGSMEKSNSLLAPKIGMSVLGIMLNIIGAKFWGISGIILAYTVYSGLHLAWLMVLVFANHKNFLQKEYSINDSL